MNFHWSLYVTLFCIFSWDLERILVQFCIVKWSIVGPVLEDFDPTWHLAALLLTRGTPAFWLSLHSSSPYCGISANVLGSIRGSLIFRRVCRVSDSVLLVWNWSACGSGFALGSGTVLDHFWWILVSLDIWHHRFWQGIATIPIFWFSMLVYICGSSWV